MAASVKDIFSHHLDDWPIAPGVYMGRGWHADRTYPWSNSQRCSLRFDLAKVEAGSEFPLLIQAFNASSHAPKLVTIYSAGHQDQHLVLERSEFQPIKVFVPCERSRPEVIFSIDTIQSPSDLGISTDPRLLGLSIRLDTSCNKHYELRNETQPEISSTITLPDLKHTESSRYTPRRIAKAILRRLR